MAARVVAAALVLSGVAPQATPTTNLTTLETPTTNLTLFKRTHASCGAFGDADFVETELGMDVSVNVSYYCNGVESGAKPCARRVVARAPRPRTRSDPKPKSGEDERNRDLDLHRESIICLNFRAAPFPETPGSPLRLAVDATVSPQATVLANFQLHYFQSFVSPELNVTTCDLAGAFAAANAFDAAWTWSEWTAQGATFFVPTLDAHVRRWISTGTAWVGRTYAARGDRFFSARVVVPHTGHVVELLSGNATARAGEFVGYGAGECGGAAIASASLPELERAWAAQGGALANTQGLPDLLPVALSQPATDVGAFASFLEAHSSQRLATAVETHATAADDCAWSRTLLNSDASLASWAVELVLVHNERPARGAYNATFVEAYTRRAMDALMACDTGYARYVDNHVGLSLGSSRPLDVTARSLCSHDVGFRAGTDGTAAWGSAWSRGAAGLGVEFQGGVDYTFFDAADLTMLDYCATLGGGPTDDYCPWNKTDIFDTAQSAAAHWFSMHWGLVAILAAAAAAVVAALAAAAFSFGACGAPAAGYAAVPAAAEDGS